MATTRHPTQRNAIGAHSGSYCIYKVWLALTFFFFRKLRGCLACGSHESSLRVVVLILATLSHRLWLGIEWHGMA